MTLAVVGPEKQRDPERIAQEWLVLASPLCLIIALVRHKEMINCVWACACMCVWARACMCVWACACMCASSTFLVGSSASVFSIGGSLCAVPGLLSLSSVK